MTIAIKVTSLDGNESDVLVETLSVQADEETGVESVTVTNRETFKAGSDKTVFLHPHTQLRISEIEADLNASER